LGCVGLTGQDILFACCRTDLVKGSKTSDDIDDLQNRKIKTVVINSKISYWIKSIRKSIIEHKQMPYKPFTLSSVLTAVPINSS
jgi:DNA-directed RNA polymerase beta subunit